MWSIEEKNQKEWENPDNWLLRRSFGVYIGRNDTRLIVPKPNPKRGWTINFGHPRGFMAFVAFTGAIILFCLVVTLLTTTLVGAA